MSRLFAMLSRIRPLALAGLRPRKFHSLLTAMKRVSAVRKLVTTLICSVLSRLDGGVLFVAGHDACVFTLYFPKRFGLGFGFLYGIFCSLGTLSCRVICSI